MKSSGKKVGRLTFLQTRLQTWREEELKRWNIPAEMSDEEIQKEVEASVQRLQREFNKARKEYSGTSEDIWNEVKHRELGRGASERLRRLLIGEDLKGMSKQLDDLFEENVARVKRLATTSYENYQAMFKGTLKKQNKAVGNFKSFAEVQKLQFDTTIQFGEMQYASLLRTEETLRSIAHSNLKSYLMSISVLRDMREEQTKTAEILEKVERRLESSENILKGVKENTNPAQQFILVVLASAAVAFFSGLFVDGTLHVWGDEIKDFFRHYPLLFFSVLIVFGAGAVLAIKRFLKSLR